MARKNRRGNRAGPSNLNSNPSFIRRETLHTILGVLSVAITIFLLLGALELAGAVGKAVFSVFSYLFGIGYYILPLVFLILAFSLLQTRERKYTWPQILGALIFFVSGLGLTSLLFVERGGVVGRSISGPLVSLFDLYAGAVILVSLALISLLVIFDASIRVDIATLLKRLFRKSPESLGNEAGNRISNNSASPELTALESERLKAYEANSQRSETSKKPIQRGLETEGFVPLITRKSGKAWSPPPLSLLEKDSGKPGVGDIKANANLIKRTLLNFGIIVEMDEVSIGPSVTRYVLKPAEGVKLSKIVGLQNNLELALAAHPVRIEAPIPGKSLVGIEVPNTVKSMVGLGSLLGEEKFARSEKPLLVALGKDIAGNSHFDNLGKMPHILVAGATGSGKSVSIHALITSLLYRNPPDDLKFIMIDPKRVELTVYNSIPHLLTPVITEPKKAIMALKWATKEMERRYEMLEKESVRDVDSYHKSVRDGDPMPFIVIIIDELADLMQTYPRELEALIVRLAQMSRAVGIHLILSTQRPSVNVITGLIKANIPARIALQVSSQIDSRTIIDSSGAEKLLGAGDMLYISGDMSKPVRIQSAYISEREVKEVVKYLKDAYADELGVEINLSAENTSNAIFSSAIGEDSTGDDDELYEDARATVMQAGKASTSFLQRRLRIGYARAARLIDLLEERGVVSPGSGARPRDVVGFTSASRESFESDTIEEARGGADESHDKA